MSDAAGDIQAIFALPPDQQREPLLALYRATYAAYGHDWETNTAVMADDYEFVARGSTMLPGLEPVLKGREGYLEGQRLLRDVVDVIEAVVDDVVPFGEGKVGVLSRLRFRTGGMEIDQQIAELHEYRDGRLVRQSYWFDRGEGRRELGL